MISRKKIRIQQFDYVIPTFDEILESDFNYPSFVENVTDDIVAYQKGIVQGVFADFDGELYIASSKHDDFKDDPGADIIHNKYTMMVNEIVNEYKQDLISNKITHDKYTGKMKRIAFEYLNELDKYLLQKQENEKVKVLAEEEKVEEPKLDIAEQYYQSELEEIKKNSRNRAIAYLNGEINIRDLYFCDLSVCINGKYSKKLLNIKSLINNRLAKNGVKDIRLGNLTIGEIEPYLSKGHHR